MILLLAAGSIHAAYDSQSELINSSDDDLELDDDFDNPDDDELDDELDGDLDDSEDDLDYNESDYGYSDYDYLEYKVISYLGKYGNCSDENWTESEDFLNEYQIYLANPSNYTLNKSSEGYKTYLKIFDSITSTFGDYNLTNNQTEYLKFMIIYYLNHYGNVSANYTWDDSESFANYTPPFDFMLGAMYKPILRNSTAAGHDDYSYEYNPFYSQANNSTDVNQTSLAHKANIEAENSWDLNIFILILLLVLIILIII